MSDALEGPVICRRCGAVCTGRPRSGFAGLRVFRCEGCSRAVYYPLSRGWRVFWWVFAIITVTTGVWANATLHAGYSWVPKGVGIVAFIALCLDVAIRHRIDRARHQSATTADVQLAASGEVPASGSAAFVGAAPAYIGALAVVITIAVGASVFGALAVAGLNNAYAYPVVDQEARAATTRTAYSGSIDLVTSSDRICGGGEDYRDCVTLHVAMYNSLCVTGGLTFSHFTLSRTAVATCEDLDQFIDDTKARLANCGYGCTTAAGDDGRWGWSYLRPIAVTVTETANDALPEVGHTEHCVFSLGPIQLGSCPGAEANQDKSGARGE